MRVKRPSLAWVVLAVFLGVLAATATHATAAPAGRESIRLEISAAATTTADALAMHTDTGDWIYRNVTDPTFGAVGGEWAILGLARSGNEAVPRYATYYDNVLAVLRASHGVLSATKYSDYSRVIIALGALGKDVTQVGGYNLLNYLADYKKVTQQGVNGAAFALIALDTHDYSIPDIDSAVKLTTRDGLIAFILDQELTDGGWALSGDKADPDVTAMTVQALAACYRVDPRVQAAVGRALTVLSDLQQADGGYQSFGVANSESASQVIMALCAMQIDPLEDSRFVKGGGTLLSALGEYYVDGGGFKHTLGGGFDQIATEQGYCALTAYLRLVNGQTALYDMSDVPITPSTPVTFIDVPSSHPYYAAIDALSKLDIIGGYDTAQGKEFRPGNPILRAQVAKMLVLGFGLHDEAITGVGHPLFPDVPLSAGVPYPFDFVQEAAANQLILGFPDGTFRPYVDVTRIQLLRMLIRGARDRLATPPAGYEIGFTDVDPSDRDTVASGVYNGIINGKSATIFDPRGSATRGQFAKMLYNVLQK